MGFGEWRECQKIKGILKYWRCAEVPKMIMGVDPLCNCPLELYTKLPKAVLIIIHRAYHNQFR